MDSERIVDVMREANRMRAVQSPIIPVVGELIRRHPGTISLGQGVAYYGPPPEAIEAVGACLETVENHKYKPVQGIEPLLAILEEKLAAENQMRISSDRRVVVTAGANMGFMNAVLAIADPGDEIVLPRPYYFNQEMAIRIADCVPVLAETNAEYQLVPEAIEAVMTPRTRAVVTVSPNNPTGAVYSETALRAVNALCRDRGVYHICDEAYEYFTYDDARHFSPGSIDGAEHHTISLYSLSKSYGFASWRIGYMVIPDHLYVAVKKIQDTILICPPVVSQYAAMGALRRGAAYCRAKLGAIAEVREIALESLAQVSDLCTVPGTQGAFYFLLRVHAQRDPMELTERLVAEHGVAVIPGTTFGVNEGCSLRMSYGSLQKETAAEGVGRLVKGLRALLRA